jgi:hypothetical protein
MNTPIKSDLENLWNRVERKEQEAKKRIIIFSIVPLVLALALLYFISSKVKERSSRLQEINHELSLKESKIKALNDSIQQLGKIALNGFGYAASKLSGISDDELKNSLNANWYIDHFVKNKELSKGLFIRYYPKGADQEKIILALKQLGFTPVSITPREVMLRIPTNAIWYGSHATLDDVKLVALSLIRAGVELKSIKPFNDPDGPKKNAIEIGAGTHYVQLKSYTSDKIIKAESLAQLNNPASD